MKPLIARCDNCGHDFDVEYKERKHNGGRRETYFKCDDCGRKYTSFVTDPKVRKWQGEMHRMKDIVLKDKHLRKIQERMNRLKAELTNG